jgi:hypothetical protein
MSKTSGRGVVGTGIGGTATGKPNTISNNIDALTSSLKRINKAFNGPKAPEGTNENPLTMENLTGKK